MKIPVAHSCQLLIMGNDQERLMKLVQAAADDVQKAEGGNKAAGTRVRKSMQEIKAAAQDVRVGILQSRGTTQEAQGSPTG